MCGAQILIFLISYKSADIWKLTSNSLFSPTIWFVMTEKYFQIAEKIFGLMNALGVNFQASALLQMRKTKQVEHEKKKCYNFAGSN